MRARLRAAGLTEADVARHLGLSASETSRALDQFGKIKALLADAERERHPPGVREAPAPFGWTPRPFITLEEAKALRDNPSPKPKLSEEDRKRLMRELKELARALRNAPRLTDMTDDEILGYNDEP